MSDSPTPSDTSRSRGLMTPSEFFETYKTSRSVFYREVQAGRIRIRKIGRSTRIALDDAEAWAASLPTNGGEASND